MNGRTHTRNARRRPGDRPELAEWKQYAHELHEIADALTRDDRKLSKLSKLAAKHGITLNVKKDCDCLCRIRKHLKALIRGILLKTHD